MAVIGGAGLATFQWQSFSCRLPPAIRDIESVKLTGQVEQAVWRLHTCLLETGDTKSQFTSDCLDTRALALVVPVRGFFRGCALSGPQATSAIRGFWSCAIYNSRLSASAVILLARTTALRRKQRLRVFRAAGCATGHRASLFHMGNIDVWKFSCRI